MIEEPRAAGARRVQQVVPRRIPVVDGHPEPSQQVDAIGVDVEHGGLDAVRPEQAAHRRPEPAEADDDDRTFLVDGVGLALALGPRAEARREDPLVDEQQQRRDGHRQGHDRHERTGHVVVEHALAVREGEQHEGELADLRQREGEQQALVQAESEAAPEHQQHDELDREHSGDQPEDEPGWCATRAKSIEAPTAMKNRPRSSPLNGSMSLSSSWRYSLVASTTPARNVPSAGDRPTALISSAMPTTSRSAAAVKISRSRVRARTRNSGRTRKRPPPTIAATAARTASVPAHAGSRATSVDASWAAPAAAACVASSGKTASIGMTAMSWKSSTANALCPPAVLSRPFSLRVWSTIAVEESDRVSPMASAGFQARPAASARPPRASAEHRDLEAAEAEDRSAQPPEQRRLQLEPDHEEHHHDAELGEVHDVLPVAAEQAEAERPDRDAGEQVAEHRPEAPALGDRHGGHRRGEVHEGLEQEVAAHRRPVLSLPGRLRRAGGG